MTRILYCLAALAIPAAAAGAPIVTDDVYTRPQRLVELEKGRYLNLYCVGSGSPTVVFDSALGDELSAWGVVQPKVARFTRACSYDRAGIGFSSPARRPGTSANIVDDLHRLLMVARITGPYILVGHSYGGLNMRLYASRYLSAVAGLVLVDPSEESVIDGVRKTQARAIQKEIKKQQRCVLAAEKGRLTSGTRETMDCIGTSSPRFSDEINRAHLNSYRNPAYQRAFLSEFQSIFEGVSGQEVRSSASSLGDVPLVVLTRAPPSGALKPDQSQSSRDEEYRHWLDSHERIAAFSTRGRNCVVETAGHYIQFESPQRVVDAITTLVSIARGSAISVNDFCRDSR